MFSAASIAKMTCFALLGALLAAPVLAATPLKPSERRGEKLAQTNCAACHAVGLVGTSPNPKSPPFRTIGQRYKLESLEEALAEGIVVGHSGAAMPHFVFEPDDINDLIAYLKRINRR